MDIKPGTSASASRTSTNYNHTYYSAEIETLTRDHLSMQVDVVAWNHKHNLLAVGGYKINPKDTTLRMGILYLIVFDSSLPSGSAIIQEENLPGILDLKWEPSEYGYVVLATSNSIVIYGLIMDEPGMYGLQRNYSCFLEVKPGLMAVYIEWITPTELIYSDTCGTVTLLGLAEQETDSEGDGDEENDPLGLSPRKVKKEGAEDDDPILHLTEVDKVTLHDSIVWVVHYDLTHKVVFTGADDGTFVAFHRTNFHKKSFWFLKRFPVGITSITTKDDVVAVGSYDDILRIFSFKLTSDADKRLGLIHHTEINLGGAVWRTIWLPDLYAEDKKNDPQAAGKVEYKIAVAAARNGIHMLTLKRKPIWAWSRHVSCLDYQGALAYGIDVKANPADKTYTVATCYFDNHALHIWKTSAY